MAIDIYSTRAMLPAVELIPVRNTFLYDMFVNDEGTTEEETVMHDFRKGDMEMAPVVHPGTGGVLMGRGGYETREIGFSDIAPERMLTNPDIKKRSFGEPIFGGMTPEQRAKKILAKDQKDLKNAIQLRRDNMVNKLIQTGKLEVFRYTNEGRDKETTLTADFRFTNNYTPDTAWDQPGAKIEYDMRSMVDLVTEGLGAVDVIVMAPDVADAMLANSNYIRLLDAINVKAGEINMKYKGQGIRFLGYNSDGVEMYSFSGMFTDDDKTRKRILPNGMMIAGSHGMIRAIHGPVTQVEDNGPNGMPKTYVAKDVPLRYASIESNSVKLRVTSRPTFIPYNVDGWAIGRML